MFPSRSQYISSPPAESEKPEADAEPRLSGQLVICIRVIRVIRDWFPLPFRSLGTFLGRARPSWNFCSFTNVPPNGLLESSRDQIEFLWGISFWLSDRLCTKSRSEATVAAVYDCSRWSEASSRAARARKSVDYPTKSIAIEVESFTYPTKSVAIHYSTGRRK